MSPRNTSNRQYIICELLKKYCTVGELTGDDHIHPDLQSKPPRNNCLQNVKPRDSIEVNNIFAFLAWQKCK